MSMDNSVERNKRIEEIRANRFDDDTEFLLSEIDRLKRRELLESSQTFWNREGFIEQLERESHRIQVGRDKAIAELRRFADRDPYATGSSAKRVLSELGVPHDPLD